MFRKLAVPIACLALGITVGYVIFRAKAAVKFDTVYQAVLLDNGQVYYGKVQGLGTPFPVLHDVYYIESHADPKTKEVTSVLVRRGKEWHGPEFTVLNEKHIVMIEPVSPGSKVAQLIAESKK
jgi:hypothetical protein